MDHDRVANFGMPPAGAPPSEAWLFAQQILGKPIPRPVSPQARARARRAELERLAVYSSRHADELRKLDAAEAKARHDRELLEWAAQISARAEEKLRALQRKEAQEREAWQRAERFYENYCADLLAEWNEADHPREPGGTPIGGRFAKTNGGANAAGEIPDRSARPGSPDGKALPQPTPEMLELANLWHQTKNALDQTRRDIQDLPKRIASDRAQLASGGRYAYIHRQNLVTNQRALEEAKALALQLAQQLDELKQLYGDLGYDDVPYSTFTPGESIVAGVGIEAVGRAMARGGTPAGLQPTGIEFDIVSAAMAGPALLRLGKEIVRKALSVVGRRAPRDTVVLTPYGGSGGGHHVGAKRAFEGAAGYDAKAALAMSQKEMARYDLSHVDITATQQRLYRLVAKSGQKISWEIVERVETEALVRAGLAPHLAQDVVHRAMAELKRAGVAGPIRIPWGK